MDIEPTGADNVPTNAVRIDPTPRWIVDEEQCDVEVKKTRYYWRLSSDATPTFRLPRYYLAYFAEEISEGRTPRVKFSVPEQNLKTPNIQNRDQKIEEEKTQEDQKFQKKDKKMQNQKICLNPYFIPECWWDLKRFEKGETSEHPGMKPFDRTIDAQILDARRLDGTTARINVLSTNNIIQRLIEGQEIMANDELSKQIKPTAPDFTCAVDETSNSWYCTFDKNPDLSTTVRYVKLQPKDIQLLNTNGGTKQPEEVYIPLDVIKGFADPDGKNPHRFAIRTGDGAQCIWALDSKVDVSSPEWTKRLNRGINSIEREGGWNRCINPKIKLFLVPVDAQFKKDLDAYAKIAQENRRKKPTGCLQEVVVLAGEELDRERMYQIGRSPFGHYETWISLETYKDYLKVRPDRQMPLSPADLESVASCIVKPEHATAAGQRTLIPVPEKKSPEKQKHTGNLITNTLTATKIRTARKKRVQALGQHEVMSISATDVAKKLKWTDAGSLVQKSGKWPATNVYASEWLHRSAFSYGGLATPGAFHTSQLRENLIFGSSKCNSVMTRYEKAFQSLIIKENTRLGGKDACHGILRSETRNVPYIIRDQTAVQKLTEPEHDPTEYGAPWICYAMDYSLQIQNCEPLGPSADLFSTRFYPFQRGFFTAFEQELDSVILKQLYGTVDDSEEESSSESESGSAGDLDDLEEELQSKANDQSIPKVWEDNMSEQGDVRKKVFVDNNRKSEQFPADRNHKKYISPETSSDDRQPRNPVQNEKGKFFKKFSQKNSNRTETMFQNVSENKKSSAYLGQIHNPPTNLGDTQDPSSGFSYFGSNYIDTSAFQALASIPLEPKKKSVTETVTSPPDLQLGQSKRTSRSDDGGSSGGSSPNSDLADTSSSASVSLGHLLPRTNTETAIEEVNYKLEQMISDIEVQGKETGSRGTNDQGEDEDEQAEEAKEIYFRPAVKKDTIMKVEFGDKKHALTAHNEAWKRLHSPADIFIDGVKLFHAEMVITAEDPLSVLINGAKPQSQFLQTQFFSVEANSPFQQLTVVPDEFVMKGKFSLFGILPAELYSLQSPNTPGIHQRVTLPGELSLGKILPSLAGSPMNAIKLFNTTFTYRSHRTPTVPAGLRLSTTILLSGFLQPLNDVLWGVFGQIKPRIEATGLISTHPSCLHHVPTPIGFTLRGELPEININLFGVLDITHLGLDIMGIRKGSAGGYDYSYGFFGTGRVSNVSVEWYVRKHHDMYRIVLVMVSESWKNVGGIVGVDLGNVQFEAGWTGTNISSVSLQVQASLNLRQSTVLLRGLYSKENIELAGTLYDCDLTTLQHIYEDIFNTTICTTTSHTVTFSTLSFLLSTQTGITLHGAVTVDGHTAASAIISLSSSGVQIKGTIGELKIGNDVKIDAAALDLNITKQCFTVRLSGSISVQDVHFDVSIYLDKSSGKGLQYAVYGAYKGEFHLRDVVSELEGTFLDVSLENVAICASNMEKPQVEIKENVFSYPITNGVQIFAQATSLKAVSDILRLKDPKPVRVCAFYRPESKSSKSSFGVKIQLPTTDLISFDRMKSGPLTLGVGINSDGPKINIKGDLYITVPGREKPLTLALALAADRDGAQGRANLIDDWNNPFDLSRSVTIGNLTVGLGIEYTTFFSTGMPSSLTLGGTFVLGEFSGASMIHISSNPTQQLVSIVIQNLDVARLISLITKVLDCDLALPNGKDIFYVEQLTLYLSTGVTINDRYYPKGVMFDAALKVFGKKAQMHAELMESKLAISGTMDSFEIGGLKVRGVRDAEPSVDIEISKHIQKIHIDGCVLMGDNKLLLELHLDSGTQQLWFEFQLVVVDALTVIVTATLEGSLPVAAMADEKAGDVAKLAPKDGAKWTEVSKVDLKDREFKLYALMEQRILDYVIELANEHFDKEGDPNREEVLRREKTEADRKWENMELLYKTKQDTLNGIIRAKESELQSKELELKSTRQQREGQVVIEQGEMERKKQEMMVRLEVDRRTVEDEGRAKMSLREAAVGLIRVAVDECRMTCKAMEVLCEAVEKTKESRATAEAEFAQFEIFCEEDQAKEPSPFDPAHAPWEWTRRELMRQLEEKRRIRYQVNCDHDIASDAFDAEAYKDAQKHLKLLELQFTDAQRALEEQRKATAKLLQSTEKEGAGELRRYEAKRLEQMKSLSSAASKAVTEEVNFNDSRQSVLDKTKNQNDIENTVEYKNMIEARKTRDSADIAYRSFNQLLHIINIFGAIYTAPLRYSIKASGTKLLDIKKIEIKGSWSGMTQKKGKVTAHVDAIIGFVSYDFDIEFDISDIVEFFHGLWMKVGQVISDVGNTLQNLRKQGEEAWKQAMDGIDKGVTLAVVAGKEFVKDVDDALEDAAEDVRNFVTNTASEVADGIVEIGEDIGDAFEDLGHNLETANKKVEHALQDLGHDIQNVANDVEGAFVDFGHDVDNVANDVGHVFEDIGSGIASWFD